MIKILVVLLVLVVVLVILLFAPLLQRKSGPIVATPDNAVTLVYFIPGWKTNNVSQSEQLLDLLPNPFKLSLR